MNRYINDIKAARNFVKKHVDIIKVVADDLGSPQKLSGSDHWWACPFHGETKPSFGVHTTMQIYRCFGCDAKGDVISWMCAFHGVPTYEAILLLATKYNIDLKDYLRAPTQQEIQHQQYTKICDEIAKYCNGLLFSDKQRLGQYLTETGFNNEQIVDYEIGYSNSTNNLQQYLYTKIGSLNQDDISRLELDSRLLWNNSLVYPIRDHVGNVVRFYSKPLSPPPDFGGKYIGTSNKHPLFTNKVLYGFNVIRNGLRLAKHSVRICEGFKAAIASRGVAVMGTNLQDAQIQLLQEHGVQEIRVAFDGDSAGKAASVRIMDYLDSISGIQVFVAQVPDGMQPDGIIRQFGRDTLDLIFSSAVLPIQFFVDLRRGKDGSISEADKHRLIQDLRKFLADAPSVNAELNVRYLSKTLDVSEESIRDIIYDVKLLKAGLFNIDAETDVIRYVLLNPKGWSLVKQNITDSKTFTTQVLEKIFIAIDTTYLKAREVNNTDGITIQSIKDELKILYAHMPKLDEEINQLLKIEPKYEFNDALNRVMDMYRRRSGIDQSRILSAMLQDLGKDTGKILTNYRRKLVSSLDVRKNESNTPNQLADSVMHELSVRSNRETSIIGYDFSTIRDVDEILIPCLTTLNLSLSGLQNGHQVVISAPSGVGKSLLGIQMATTISICPQVSDMVPTLWIPLEMNALETSMRILSQLSGVNNTIIQQGKMSDEQKSRVSRASEMMAKGQLYIKKPRSGTIDEIYAIIDEYNFRYGVKAVFVDYLQLIADGVEDKGASREQVIGRASKVMKNQVAEGMGMVSVCIAQQNRSNYRAGEASDIQSVAGSYQISQDADDMMILAEYTKEQKAERANLNAANRLIFLDKRRGGTSDTRIDAVLDTDTDISLRFEEILDPKLLTNLVR